MLYLELNNSDPRSAGYKKTSVMFGDSAYEVVNYLRNRPRPHYFNFFRNSVDNGGKIGVLGSLGVDYPAALNMVIEGWDEGVRLMHRGLEAMIGVNAPGINRWKHDVAGEQPDVLRALAGDPRSMLRKTFNKGSKPIIHIVVNTAMQGNATDTQTMNYGIAILGLIDYLESRGKRVELDRLGVVVDNWWGSNSKRSMQGWKVKRADEPADLSVIAFSIAHPASHRKLVWAMRADCLAVYPAGSAANITENDAKLIDAPNAFILDSVESDGHKCNTPQSALILAGERLNKAAGEELVNLAELRVEA